MRSLLSLIVLVAALAVTSSEVKGHEECGYTRLEEPDDHHKEHWWHQRNPGERNKHLNGCKFSPLPPDTMLRISPQKYSCLLENSFCNKPHYWGGGSAELGALTFWLKSVTDWQIDKVYVLRKENCKEKEPEEGMLSEEVTECKNVWRSIKTLPPETRVRWNDRIKVTSQ